MQFQIRTFALAGLLLVSTAQARPTVLDYWMKVKNQFSGVHFLSVDLRNDYLEFSGDWEGGGQMAVWRYQGRDLIGLTTTGCGPVCNTTTLKFLDPQQGYKDVTKVVIPKLDAAAMKKVADKHLTEMGGEAHFFTFNLPHEGTTIRLLSGYDKDVVLGNLEFDQKTGRFRFQAVKP